MDAVFMMAMTLLLVYVLYKNLQIMGRYKHNKEYIECYKTMLNEDEQAYEKICAYISSGKSEEFTNKARILKLYTEMDKNLDSAQTLEELQLKPIFYKNNKPSKNQINMNAEVFIWLYLDMARARRLSRFDVLNGLYEKLMEIPELASRVEYQTAIAVYNALCEREDAGVGFLSIMLEGGYTELAYDKNLIMLYKRFAAATLAYTGEPMDDFYKEDLHAFAASQIGAIYMKDLEIYDKYPPIVKEEPAEETAQEEEKTEE